MSTKKIDVADDWVEIDMDPEIEYPGRKCEPKPVRKFPAIVYHKWAMEGKDGGRVQCWFCGKGFEAAYCKAVYISGLSDELIRQLGHDPKIVGPQWLRTQELACSMCRKTWHLQVVPRRGG